MALAITPASGSIDAKVTACRIDLTSADVHDESTYDEEDVPTMAQIIYRLEASKSGFGEVLKSVVFTPNSEGKWTWDNLIFPEDGSWTIRLRNMGDDSSVETLAVTVS